MAADAEAVLGPIENQRDDQIFLVVEVTPELSQQAIGRPRIGFAGLAQRVGMIDRRAQEGVRRLDRSSDRVVDRLMVAFKHVEAEREARLGRLKDREVVQVLDLVMRMELLKEELETRGKPGAEVLRGGAPLAEGRDRVVQRRADFAEHVVPR